MSEFCHPLKKPQEHHVAKQITPEEREKRRKRVASWRARNPERARAMSAAWKAKNPDQVKAGKEAWRAANPEKYQSIRAEYAETNRRLARIWYSNNRERAKVNGHNRRARELSGGVLSPDLFERLIVLQRGKCACCRTTLTCSNTHMDHVKPLIRGGSNTDENIQLLCAPCNRSKHTADPITFMQSRGFLL